MEQSQERPSASKKSQGKAKKPKVKVKRVHEIGVFTILFIILIAVGIFLFTPISAFIISLIPKSYQNIITQKVHKEIIIDTSNKKLSEPFKYEPIEPLPVLGERSGICFYFRLNDDVKKLVLKANKRKEIAEIIVIDDHKTEYKLKSMATTKSLDNNYNASVICQNFGLDYPSTPDIIKNIYVRPIQPFTPYKVIWVTKKTIYTD